MTRDAYSAVRAYCRASKRAHDRADVVLASLHAGAVDLRRDPAYRAAVHMENQAWLALPETVRAAIRRPEVTP